MEGQREIDSDKYRDIHRETEGPIYRYKDIYI